MTPEQLLQKAQQLAQRLAGVDDNEVKKVYNFLCRQRQISALHQLVKALLTSPFKERSGRTHEYYSLMARVIPSYLPETMDVHDAMQILGWACRLLKYEEASGSKQPPRKTKIDRKPFEGGRRR